MICVSVYSSNHNQNHRKCFIESVSTILMRQSIVEVISYLFSLHDSLYVLYVVVDRLCQRMNGKQLNYVWYALFDMREMFYSPCHNSFWVRFCHYWQSFASMALYFRILISFKKTTHVFFDCSFANFMISRPLRIFSSTSRNRFLRAVTAWRLSFSVIDAIRLKYLLFTVSNTSAFYLIFDFGKWQPSLSSFYSNHLAMDLFLCSDF
jgi:hypothetical protein